MTLSDGWTEYNKMLTDRLDRLDAELQALRGDVIGLRESMAVLRVKASIWGAMAGAVPVLIALALAVLHNALR